MAISLKPDEYQLEFTQMDINYFLVQVQVIPKVKNLGLSRVSILLYPTRNLA